MLAALLGVAAALVGGHGAEQIYSRTENSVFTVEVHTGNRETKSVLGSGYLIAADGKIVTNYHVIEAFVDDPQRYQIRVRNRAGEFPADLVQFDVINDLALLSSPTVKAKPFKLALDKSPLQGSAIISMGNPMGLHLSIIRGIFNGYAEKGLIDRMLLSMPLNSGMSGGPILNQQDEIIGTNVAIIWLSNSLSFGVPVSKLPQLLRAEPLTKDKETYRQEIARQLYSLESSTVGRLSKNLASGAKHDTILVGNSQFDRPPDMFDCWDSSKNFDEQGISKATYSCNLQFTPTLGSFLEIASVELLVEHLATRDSSYGFYGYLTEHGDAHHLSSTKNGNDVNVSNPECTSDRTRIHDVIWKINTCINAYVDYPDLYDFGLVAYSVTRPKEAIYVSFNMRGFKLESFKKLSRIFLEQIHFADKS